MPNWSSSGQPTNARLIFQPIVPGVEDSGATAGSVNFVYMIGTREVLGHEAPWVSTQQPFTVSNGMTSP